MWAVTTCCRSGSVLWLKFFSENKEHGREGCAWIVNEVCPKRGVFRFDRNSHSVLGRPNEVRIMELECPAVLWSICDRRDIPGATFHVYRVAALCHFGSRPSLLHRVSVCESSILGLNVKGGYAGSLGAT